MVREFLARLMQRLTAKVPIQRRRRRRQQRSSFPAMLECLEPRAMLSAVAGVTTLTPSAPTESNTQAGIVAANDSGAVSMHGNSSATSPPVTPTVNWTGGGDGQNWNDPKNWSTDSLPGASSDVVIDLAANINGPTTATKIDSLTVEVGNLSLGGGKLTVTNAVTIDSGQSLTVSDGAVLEAATYAVDNATLAVAGGASSGTISGGIVTGNVVIEYGGTVNDVTINGNIDATQVSSSTFYVTGSLDLNGSLLLGAANGSSNAAVWFGDGSATPVSLSGNATIVFGGDSHNMIDDYINGGQLTLPSTYVVRGQSGFFQIQDNNGSFVNKGTISADVAGGAISLGVNSPATFQNTGTMKAINGDTLDLDGGPLVNTGGVISVDNAKIVLNDVTITGGTINTAVTGDLVVSGNGVTLNGVTINGTVDMTQSTCDLYVTGSLDLNGSLLLGAANGSSNAAVWFGDGSATPVSLSGNATIVFGEDSHNMIDDYINGGQLTLPSTYVVRGQSGFFQVQDNNGSFVNKGTISADVAGGAISLGVNSPATFQNTGTMKAINGDTLDLDGGPLVNTGGVISVDNAKIVLNDVTITGGTINTTATGDLVVSGNGVTLNGVTINGTVDMTQSTCDLYVTGSLDLNGTLLLGATNGSSSAAVYFGNGSSATAGLTGNAMIMVGGSPNDGFTNDIANGVYTLGSGVGFSYSSGTSSSPETLVAISQDLGATAAGFVNNSAVESLNLSGSAYVQLTSIKSSAPLDAVYVNTLDVPAGTTLNLNGIHIYAYSSFVQGTVLGGTIQLVAPPALPGGATVATSDVTASGLRLDLSTGGALYYWTGPGASWTQIAGNTSSLQVGSNGTAYALLPYGGLYGWTLAGGWSFVAGNVSSYHAGPNGAAYVLQPGGNLSISQNGVLSPLKSNVSSFQVAPNGTVYAQLPYGALESWTPGGAWTSVAGNVSSYYVAPTGTVYVLQPGGNLSTWQNSSLSTLKSNVSSFEVAPNGTVYAQLPYGALESWAPGGTWTLVSSNVSSYHVGPNGTLYVLQPGGNLDVWQNGSLSSIQTNVSSFQVVSNGMVYALLPYGVLESSTGPGSSWTQLEGNVSSFRVAPNGMLYALQPGGNLDLWEYGSWALVAAKTNSFQIGSDGTLYDMLPNGGLYTWSGFGGTWSPVAGNVSSYKIASNGTLYVLQAGNLDIWENGNLALLAANTSSFQVGPDGTLYLVLPGNSLYSWSGFGGTWTSLESNITSYDVATNGTLYALQSGTLAIWESGAWATLTGNASSFDIGSNGTVYIVLPGNSLYDWTGFGGIWTSLESNISGYDVAPNGMLYALQSSNLAVWENGSWATLTGNASSFQIGPDGTLYMLLPGSALYSWTGFGGAWAFVDSNVQSYQILPNGEIDINGQLFS